jgi:sensor histidine kinase YesM
MSQPSPANSTRHRLKGIWRDILLVGGAVWIVLTAIEVLWFWPVSGTTDGGQTVLTPGIRTAAQFAEFLVAAMAFRIAAGMGWPSTVSHRLAVTGVNLLLVVAVLWMRIVIFRVGGLAMASWAQGHVLVTLTRDWWPVTRMDWAAGLRFTLPTYLLALALIALYRTARRYHEESLQLVQLAARYSQTQLTMLSAQLQPHFLFNSLSLIAELVASRPEQAILIIARLGDFLRHALEASRRPWSTIDSEFFGLRAYLAVQEARYENRLSVYANADEDTMRLYIPSMLLQPLVENAIEHGRTAVETRLHVEVLAHRNSDGLVVEVLNSTPRLERPVSPEQHRAGLRNVTQRLLAAYHGAAALSVGPDGNRGTRARLVLPVMETMPVGAKG